MNYTITLTDAQQKALEYIAYDPQEWIENAIYNRCRIAMDEIFQQECERISSEGGSISGTKDDIILAAPIQTARERQDEFNQRILEEQQAAQQQQASDAEAAQQEEETLVRESYENL